MPTNEILAASYILINYVNSVARHRVRAYFDALPVNGGGGNWVFPTYTDATHPLGWSVEQIVHAFMTRLCAGNAGAGQTVESIEVWQPVAGVNTFLGLSDVDPSSYGSGTKIASAYITYLFNDDHRHKMTFTVFEGLDSAPQRFALATPPILDDNSFVWFVVNSVIGFTTNDGHRLTRPRSRNQGYNRRLARSYGRQVAP